MLCINGVVYKEVQAQKTVVYGNDMVVGDHWVFLVFCGGGG